MNSTYSDSIHFILILLSIFWFIRSCLKFEHQINEEKGDFDEYRSFARHLFSYKIWNRLKEFKNEFLARNQSTCLFFFTDRANSWIFSIILLNLSIGKLLLVFWGKKRPKFKFHLNFNVFIILDARLFVLSVFCKSNITWLEQIPFLSRYSKRYGHEVRNTKSFWFFFLVFKLFGVNILKIHNPLIFLLFVRIWTDQFHVKKRNCLEIWIFELLCCFRCILSAFH